MFSVSSINFLYVFAATHMKCNHIRKIREKSKKTVYPYLNDSESVEQRMTMKKI